MTKLNKKILIVTNSFSGGGAEDSAYKVYSELKREGFEINLCVINMNEGEKPPPDVYSLERKWKSGPKETYRSFKRFKSLVISEQPQTIVVHCELPEMFAAGMAFSKAQIICVEHTSKPWYGRRIIGAIVRLVLQIKKTKWVTVSSNRPPIWFGSDSPIYIPNPVQLEKWEHSKKSKTEIVYIGRLRKEKRPEWAINSAIDNGMRIDIYGDGPELSYLAKKYSPNSNLVDFKGYKNNPWREIGQDALVVVPSEFEGDGMVVVEAILNNNPILLSDNRDLRRFKLPDANYFQTEDELISKISVEKVNQFVKLKPAKEVISGFLKTRNLDAVVDQWKRVLEI